MVGLESRVQAEARVAGERMRKLEMRVDRIAFALRRLLAEDSNPSDSEDE